MPVIKQNESSYQLIPAGSHPARCYQVISLGTQHGANPTYKPSFQVVLGFELPNETLEINGERKPMAVSHFLNAYLGSSAKPSKTNLLLQSWRGKPFTAEELCGFDLAKVLGAPALLNIIHEVKAGKTREKIASISPLPRGMSMNGPINKPVVWEIEQGRDETFKSLPEWMRKMIEKSEEWTAPQATEAPQEEPASDPSIPF